MIRFKLAEFIPPRFHKRNGFRYLYSIALTADATLEMALQGMAARIPGMGTPTALSRISRDRGIRRGYAESEIDFAARLPTWLTDRKKQGTAFELMRKTQQNLSPKKPRIRHVIHKPALGVCMWRTLNTDGTTEQELVFAQNFVWDGREGTDFGSRAWLIIYSTGAEAPWQQDGTWDDGATRTWAEDEAVGTWGSTASAAQIQSVVDIVREWKSAATLYPEIIVSFDDDLFEPLGAAPPNPDGNWRFYSKMSGGASVPARAEDAVYWIGTG